MSDDLFSAAPTPAPARPEAAEIARRRRQAATRDLADDKAHKCFWCGAFTPRALRKDGWFLFACPEHLPLLK